jgi:hypothetical protein
LYIRFEMRAWNTSARAINRAGIGIASPARPSGYPLLLGDYEQFGAGLRVSNEIRVVRGHSAGKAGSINVAIGLSEIDLL